MLLGFHRGAVFGRGTPWILTRGRLDFLFYGLVIVITIGIGNYFLELFSMGDIRSEI